MSSAFPVSLLAKTDCIINLCLFFSNIAADGFAPSPRGCSITATLTVFPEAMMPLLGRTQYRFGAVVFTLKAIGLSVGFDR